MACKIVLLVILSNILLLKCQEDHKTALENGTTEQNKEVSNYAYSYKVADDQTKDIKTVYESKDGDSVKGHYSVLEPSGSMRYMKYATGSAVDLPKSPESEASVLPEQQEVHKFIKKSARDYRDRYEDFDYAETYKPKREKKKRKPQTDFSDYSYRKRPNYLEDLETSDFTHSISVKHPHDESVASSESHSHFGMNPETWKKPYPEESTNGNYYPNLVELDLKQKVPLNSYIVPEAYKDNFEKYMQNSPDFDKLLRPYYIDGQFRPSKPGRNKLKNGPLYDSESPYIPDIPSADKYYPDDLSSRPKRKRPPKNPEYFYPESEEYVWVPKKKYRPHKIRHDDEYAENLETDEDYNHHSNISDDDDRHPSKGRGPKKEVVRKVVKKRKPGFNLLDILDI